MSIARSGGAGGADDAAVGPSSALTRVGALPRRARRFAALGRASVDGSLDFADAFSSKQSFCERQPRFRGCLLFEDLRRERQAWTYHDLAPHVAHT